MSYHLFLDDERRPNQVVWAKLPENASWTIVRNFDEFRETIINKGLPSYVTFDCDLAEEHYRWVNKKEFLIKQYAGEFKDKTGIDCALFLINYCEKFGRAVPQFNVHSMNAVGGDEIRRILLKSQKELDERATFK